MTTASDDLDALFDEVSAQRLDIASPSDDVDLDVLFDQTSSTLVMSAPDKAVVGSHLDSDSSSGVVSEKPIFDRLGGIVRLLHDSLRELGYDKGLSEASTQIGDAQGRLDHVADLTEKAANKVLNTLDEGMPAQDLLSKNAKAIDLRWDLLFAGNLSVDEFKELAMDSKAFSAEVVAATDAEKARLLEIMMAQDFQDITGQLIKKVVSITKIVEQELAQILRDNAPAAVREKLVHVAAPVTVDLMSGPSAPTVALDQSNVDDLLADLGF
jgi:chemotaxis protein CheZ